MTTTSESSGRHDPHNLNRFVEAQQGVYQKALAEIANGDKRSHWMWFIFPQLQGLGRSSTAQWYAIANLDEARAYLNHPILGPRLLECAEAAYNVQGRTAAQIFGSTDAMKLRSSATLFAQVAPPGSVFERLLDKYYEGRPDPNTLHLLGITGPE